MKLLLNICKLAIIIGGVMFLAPIVMTTIEGYQDYQRSEQVIQDANETFKKIIEKGEQQ